MLDLLDNGNVLSRYRFVAMSLDRPPKYGPNEINMCTYVDRQMTMKKAELKIKFSDLTTVNAVFSTFTTELISDQLKPVSDKILEQFNSLISTCNK